MTFIHQWWFWLQGRGHSLRLPVALLTTGNPRQDPCSAISLNLKLSTWHVPPLASESVPIRVNPASLKNIEQNGMVPFSFPPPPVKVAGDERTIMAIIAPHRSATNRPANISSGSERVGPIIVTLFHSARILALRARSFSRSCRSTRPSFWFIQLTAGGSRRRPCASAS